MKICVLMTIFFPLLGGIFVGFLGSLWSLLSTRLCQIITTGLVFLSAGFSLCLFKTIGLDHEVLMIPLFSWVECGNCHISFAFYVDTVSLVMMCVITLISALVHLYSIGYMARDQKIPKFMAYLSIFTFFMLLLVMAPNLVQMFLGWEGVGLFSYLLIGFWYTKPEAILAAQKAFIVNRIADLAFIFALGLIYIEFKTFDIPFILESLSLKTHVFSNFEGVLSGCDVVCLLFVIAAMGKSAQIGFHTWLADAMEGPTPVSALIHAATMVTAGVFLIVRLSPLFEKAGIANSVLVVVGASTAFFASMVACAQNDIKRLIAYSTCSQVGYMFFSAGLAGYAASMFHLYTHAFFKALLFLGAGSVIHALSNEQNLWRMGGIARSIPVTYVLLWVGSLALMGIPIFSGYYSKETILEMAWGASGWLGNFAFWMGTCSVLLTAFYSGKLLFLTFHGKIRADERVMAHIHESPPVMIIPLVILSLGAILAGYIGYGLFIENKNFFWGGALTLHLQELTLSHFHTLEWKKKSMAFLFPQGAGLLGISLAFIFYIWKTSLPEKLSKQFHELYIFISNKCFFDEFYQIIFVRPLFVCGNFLWRQGDRYGIDKYGPQRITQSVLWISKKVSSFQTGFIPQYAFIMIAGLMIASLVGIGISSEVLVEKAFYNFPGSVQRFFNEKITSKCILSNKVKVENL